MPRVFFAARSAFFCSSSSSRSAFSASFSALSASFSASFWASSSCFSRSASSFARRSASSSCRFSSSRARRSSSAFSSARRFSSSRACFSASLARRSSSFLASSAAFCSASIRAFSSAFLSTVVTTMAGDSDLSPLGFSTTSFHSPAEIFGNSALAFAVSDFPEATAPAAADESERAPLIFSPVFTFTRVTVAPAATLSTSTGRTILLPAETSTSAADSTFLKTGSLAFEISNFCQALTSC